MRKILLSLLFSLSLFPNVGYKMSLITPFSAMAQTSSSELFECEDDLFGPYESSFPCEATPCVTRCDICLRSYPCDEECPAIIFCPECIDYHHENMCPKEDDPDIPPIPDPIPIPDIIPFPDVPNDQEISSNDNQQGSTIPTGRESGSGGGGISGSENNSNPVIPKKVDRTKKGPSGLIRNSDIGKDSKNVADSLVKIVYNEELGSCASVFLLASENGSNKDYLKAKNNVYKNAQLCIESIIDEGGVLIVGVDYQPNKGIYDGTTDHYLVITGYEILDDGTKYYRYLETGTDFVEIQQDTNNRLYPNDTTCLITGIPRQHPEWIYTVTQVWPNYGNEWAGVTYLCSNE